MPASRLREGQRAFVTGAGTGIGRAIAEALAAAGAQVAVTDLDLANAQAVAEPLKGAMAFRLDVTDAAETRLIVERPAADLGGLEIVCANAGVSTMRPVVDLSEEEWDHNMAVNAKGVFLTDQAAVRHLLANSVRSNRQHRLTCRQAGRAAAGPLRGQQVRGGGLHPVARPRGGTARHPRELRLPGLRSHLDAGPRGVLGSAAARHEPAAVREEYIAFTPLGRLEEPEDVADAVVFLASDAARFITGKSLNVTGGVRMD